LVLYVYAVTLFVSAFILFLVQPLIGKMILPKLGGTPQVWNTCMVFFQMVLLAGYAYTHVVSTTLKLRQQIILHAILLGMPLIVLFAFQPNFFTLYLPVVPQSPGDPVGWAPSNLGDNPILATLRVLAIVIGLPFLVVATTAPLLQKWFAYTGHPAARDPYFLYGASNLGSLLALIAYPVIIEPTTYLSTQTWIWACGYFVLVGSVLACIGLVWGRASHVDALAREEHASLTPAAETPQPVAMEAATAVAAGAPAMSKQTGIRPGGKKGGGGRGTMPPARSEVAATPVAVHRPSDHIDFWRRARWVALAAVPSSLMLGITTHITTDLSPIPLFWVIPLALYLLTFILVFSRWPLNWIEQAHPFVLYIQPVLIAMMVFLDMMPTTQVTGSIGISGFIIFQMLGFFATTLVCHGELAKDRPSTRYLTEFYLWMSVGGMVGGMFNALLAPVAFKWGLVELPIAVLAACLLRPKMKDTGWTDELVSGLLEPGQEVPQHGPRGKQAKPQTVAKTGATSQMAYTLDVVLPLGVLALSLAFTFFLTDYLLPMFGVAVQRGRTAVNTGPGLALSFGLPLAIACFYFGRPVRFGLAVGAVMLAHFLFTSKYDHSEYNDRSFFGIISVKKSYEFIDKTERPYLQLLHGTTNHGMCFQAPEQDDVGKPDKDFTRLATTYYHRLGPAGRVMELFNWFPNSPDNVYTADARMPTAIVGHLMGDLGAGTLPIASFTNLWSEPPYATIGLGTGTMASYGRPYQHVHYYEIDNHIRKLSLPGNTHFYSYDKADDIRGKRYFTYLDGAIRRGSQVEVLMGDARLRMALPYGNFAQFAADESKYLTENKEPPGGPEHFYHMMVVDAFSSDAIPAHLITKEAIRMYFKHLTEEGVLCVHTSNRYVSLPKVVAAVTLALNDELTEEEKAKGHSYTCLRGHDQAPGGETGHFTSEWVMVTRKPSYMTRVKEKEPEEYMKQLRAFAQKRGGELEPYWNTLNPQRQYLWTDNYYTLWTVLRRRGDRD
jgi:hypothetical protein